MRRRLIVLCLLAALESFAGEPPSSDQPAFRVVNTFPHRLHAFTQGLVVRGDTLIESIGRYRHSSVAILDLEGGGVRRERALPGDLFGEGLTLFDGHLYQLTWRAGRVFLYDADTLEAVGAMSYKGEGWGLTHDGSHLIMSDGSAVLYFRKPDDFSVARRVTVTEHGRPLKRLNELEWVEGSIYANVYLQDRIVAIDPQDGVVRAALDLSPLARQVRAEARAGVLNGIAWDAATRRLFITGKNWPAVYQIEWRGAR